MAKRICAQFFHQNCAVAYTGAQSDISQRPSEHNGDILNTAGADNGQTALCRGRQNATTKRRRFQEGNWEFLVGLSPFSIRFGLLTRRLGAAPALPFVLPAGAFRQAIAWPLWPALGSSWSRFLPVISFCSVCSVWFSLLFPGVPPPVLDSKWVWSNRRQPNLGHTKTLPPESSMTTKFLWANTRLNGKIR